MQLFGKGAITDGSVIDMAEHQRVGGVSTGKGYKAVGILNASGSLVSDFGGSSSALATVTAVQGPAGAVPWLVTMGTLSVIGSITVDNVTVAGGSLSNYNAGGSLTAYQGGAPWNVLASLSGSPTVLNAGGSLSAYVAGGSLTAYQGSAPWNVLASLSGTPVILNGGGSLSAYNAGGSMSVAQLGSWSVANGGGSLSAYNVGGSLSAYNVGGSLSSYAVGGSLTAFQGAAPWSVANAGGSMTVYPGNVPNTVAWLVTMSTLAIGSPLPTGTNSIGTVQPGNTPNTVGWLVTLATISSIGTVSALGIGTVGPMKAEDVAHATGDMGIPAWGVRNASLATLSSADLDYIPFSLHADGTQYVMSKAFDAMTTMVSASATKVTLLSANPQRKGASFYNDSSAILYLKHGANASTTSYKLAMAANSYYEVPTTNYVGVISGTWASATGAVAVTEEY